MYNCGKCNESKCITWLTNFLSILQVESIDDYDEYCHYVAGLVGLGLSKLFHASGKEDLAPDSLANSMGLFLQVLTWSVLWPISFIPSLIFWFQILCYVWPFGSTIRKQISFEITWKILMRYRSRACFGLVRYGVNMLINLRCISLMCFVSILLHLFSFQFSF